jgi:hypothetical protein
VSIGAEIILRPTGPTDLICENSLILVMSSWNPLSPDRAAVVSLFATTTFQAALAIVLIVSGAWTRKRISKVKLLEVFISVAFIIHASTGIAAVIDLNNGVVDSGMFAKLKTSCGFSLIYMMSMMVPVALKIKVMEFSRWKEMTLAFAIPIFILKCYSIYHIEGLQHFHSLLNILGKSAVLELYGCRYSLVLSVFHEIFKLQSANGFDRGQKCRKD